MKRIKPNCRLEKGDLRALLDLEECAIHCQHIFDRAGESELAKACNIINMELGTWLHGKRYESP